MKPIYVPFLAVLLLVCVGIWQAYRSYQLTKKDARAFEAARRKGKTFRSAWYSLTNSLTKKK